jgi:metallo-beta-lactamase class B
MVKNTFVVLAVVASGIAGWSAEIAGQRGGAPPAGGQGGRGAAAPTASQFAASKQAQAHVAAALAMARSDLLTEHKTFCSATGPQRPLNARQAAGLPPEPNRLLEPTRIFDNVYYIGFTEVGAWAITTSDGIVVFDTLNNTEEARDILVPGLKKLGLDPAQIKYVVIGHGHNDHAGGGVYLQNTYSPRVILGAPDWDAIEAQRGDRPRMKRDMDVATSQTLTLGDTTMTLMLTPGHTPGSIAMILPVKHQGRTHTATIWGGFTVARKQSAETALANHPGILMNTVPLIESLRAQYPTGSHPLLFGAERFGRYMSIMLECSKARLAALESSPS